MYSPFLGANNKGSEKSAVADAQTEMYLCSSYMQKQVFLLRGSNVSRFLPFRFSGKPRKFNSICWN